MAYKKGRKPHTRINNLVRDLKNDHVAIVLLENLIESHLVSEMNKEIKRIEESDRNSIIAPSVFEKLISKIEEHLY